MKYCNNCLQPDTRPGIKFHQDGICPACRYHDSLIDISMSDRLSSMRDLVDFGRRNNTSGYDCIIGVSGGKDSLRQCKFVKDVLKMKPLTVCLSYPPEQVTQRGVNNLANLSQHGFDCIMIQPSPGVWRHLMRKGFFNYANWCKSTELALFSSVPRIAIAYQIPLIWWGENSALQLGDLNVMGKSGWDGNNLRKMNTLANGDFNWMLDDKISRKEILQYQYPSEREIERSGLQIAFLGYFWKIWSLRDNGAYSALNGLKIRAEKPWQIGDPTGVTSLDEDWVTLNQMIKYLKFGFGRVTDYVNEDIRNGRITRDAGISLLEKYDGKCSQDYIQSFCGYININLDDFWSVVDTHVNKKLFYKRSAGTYERLFDVGVGS